ncbi:lipopolysaccharide biosynthesis protein [Ruminococcus flavefaciens]|uniref:lipopolysaccharide biosynthesis protein n=1 Tax=Ruminococcus flavefaciens TaxID=1265 RepID=UPI0026EF3296|nr:oligosaccharide flippase family protein [Ruminococcus flavefaciens]MDD7516925.1 oligosaccharide flippase family protein [Ruminococcus flavefaciens]MDY5691039.1 oligosaccharide flippase family protein [Ruminococcus flavefaciens]
MDISIKKLRSKSNSMSQEAKASVAYTICSVLQKCLSIITMPLFTRLMSTEQYGEMTVYTSWTGLFSIILTFNLAYGSFSPAMLKFEKDREGYVSSIQGICIVLTCIFVAIYLPFTSLWNGLFKMSTLLVILLIFETFAANSINLWSGLRRFEYVYKPVVALTLAMSIGSTVVSVLAVLMSEETKKGSARIIGHAAVWIAIGLVIFIYSTVKGKKLFNKEYWSYALKFNVPLLAYYLSQMIFNQSDRIMIDHYCGKGKAAIYGVAYTLAIMLTFVLNAINNSYVPWFYKKIKLGKEEENAKVSLGIAGIMAVLILSLVMVAPEVIRVMAGKEYLEAKWIIPPVAISLLLLFYAQLFINVQFYYEKKGKLVYASVGAAVINIILNALLIPSVSYIAAGYTTLVSYIIFAVMNYFTMKSVAKEENFSLKALNIKGLILLFIVFSGLCFAIMALYDFIIIRYAVIAVCGIICIIKRRQVIAFVMKTIKHS